MSLLPQRTVQFGAGDTTRAYTITPLPKKAAADWRQQFDAPFAQLTGVLRGMNLLDTASGSTGVMFGTDGRDIGATLDVVRTTLLGSVDLVWQLLYAYSPAIAADSDWLDDHAYDDQAVDALMEVLKLAFPLQRVAAGLSGLPQRSTSKN